MLCLLRKPVNSPKGNNSLFIFGPTIDGILELEAMFVVLYCRHLPMLYVGGNCGPFRGSKLPTGTEP